MKLDELISELSSARISLSLDGGQLKVRAPKGALTSELKQRLAESKAALVGLLSRDDPDSLVRERAPKQASGIAASGRGRAARPLGFSLFFFSSDESALDADKYRLFLQASELADEQGFEAIWIPERHFHRFGGLFPNPSLLASALAMRTRRARLRAGSVVLPLQNPVRVAEEWSVVDNLSGGRVDLAFARGWNANDFVLAPDNYERRTEIFYEGIDQVRRLWRGDEVELPNGEGKPTPVRVYPSPVQRELEPWITCSGGKDRFVEAGAMGANALTALLFQTVDELAEKIAAYRAARRQGGHDPEKGRVTLMMHAYLDETSGEAMRKVRDPFTRYLKDSVSLWRSQSAPLERLGEREKEDLFGYAFERYARSNALFGSEADAHSMALALQEAGVDEIACLIDFGTGLDDTLRSVKRIGSVMNRLREPLPANGGRRAFPLSHAQRRLYASQQLEPESLEYNHPWAFRIGGNIEPETLRRAMIRLAVRHESLRTIFREIEGDVAQEALVDPKIDLQYTDESGSGAPFDLKAFVRPFQLDALPLWRVALYRSDSESCMLYVDMHHIITDGSSFRTFIAELLALCEEDASLPPTLQYSDYALWERERAGTDSYAKGIAFWQASLQGADPTCRIETDFPRPAEQSFRSRQVSVQLPLLLRTMIDARAKESGITPFIFFLSVYAILASHRSERQRDIIVGSNAANRIMPGSDAIIGCFVNQIALRLQLVADESFESLLKRARQAAFRCYDHQDIPFDVVVKSLGIRRDPSFHPLFQTKLGYRSLRAECGSVAGRSIESIDIYGSRARVDLQLNLVETAERIYGQLDYNEDLFRPQTAADLAEDFLALCESVATRPQTSIDELLEQLDARALNRTQRDEARFASSLRSSLASAKRR